MDNLSIAFPVGQVIYERMNMNHWNARQLAKKMEVEMFDLLFLMQGTKDLTEDMALKLAIAFENDPEYWIYIDNVYKEWKEKKSGENKA